MLSHHFERFVAEYEERFEKPTGFEVLRREANEGGYFRPIIKDVVEEYLDCGNPPSYIFEQVALTRPPHKGLRSVALMAAASAVHFRIFR